MIHLLEITPELAPAQLKKLARRYAMTGGVELALKSDLTARELEEIAECYIPEFANYPGHPSERRNSLPAQILNLVRATDQLPSERAFKIDELLKA